jgi:hypothetical protein
MCDSSQRSDSLLSDLIANMSTPPDRKAASTGLQLDKSAATHSIPDVPKAVQSRSRSSLSGNLPPLAAKLQVLETMLREEWLS